MGGKRTAAHVSALLLFGVLLVATSAVRRDSYYANDGGGGVKLCDLPGCECTTRTAWQVINCTFGPKEDVEIGRGAIPPNTLELYVGGGNLLTLRAQSFHELDGFELLYVHGTRLVVIKEQAFDGIRTASVLDVHVAGCNYLLLETRAFKNMLTSIRSNISGCDRVDIRRAVFGRLQEAHVADVTRLNLSEGAFIFENQTERGRHGIVTNISFHNVTMPQIPRRAFVSALSSIDIRDSTIEQIDSQAFAANEISAILLANTHIGQLRSGALSERTLIKFLLLRNCTVDLLQSQAVMAAITNITVEFSSIKHIESGAVNCSVAANIVISNNKLHTLSPHSFVFRDWNSVLVESNIIQSLHADFLTLPYNPDIVRFSFSGNEIHEAEAHAFDAIPELARRVVHFRFDDNSFHEHCRCGMAAWMSALMNDSLDVEAALRSSYCKVNVVIANCFKIQQDLISMANYTHLVCGPGANISCEPYNGVTKPITNGTFVADDDGRDSRVPLILLLACLLILAGCGTLVILLIRGGLWLRRKGYCMRFEYAQRADGATAQHEDEGAMVMPADEAPELTNELLAELREQLKNPETHDKAREMIEILYERFVIEESYTNNNRQDEEAHLYEELGNMQNGGGGAAIANNRQSTDDFLKVMAEKINFPLIDAGEYQQQDQQPTPPKKPVVDQQYSEPLDAAVHFYSELKNKGEHDAGGTAETEEVRKNSIKSFGSTGSAARMALRPLPDKPGEPGPSSKQY